ncbi:uncharacterized protein ACLA_009170 [Aspergillus clavatus NRRL 1]|uniref:Guanine nucleotide-exchange factor SEC12 n=1 Tax=Aspergillus clavatus (strain ATCC 1007 / CBS 513.65 / DSM 816 / NCTC 3887 / NRRL 1 / QM 1276 / 107) TaxID=344612 RepID=A1C9S9_ASPCL|nr:uncharacterized protein ACLA_009170 [Aspergillus clavatus NRRL 1]EAW12497.1 conserved hypothetical protein [Aspergillus clavatus NRRL 1]
MLKVLKKQAPMPRTPGRKALLNTSKRSEISEVVDIELSRDEDSVTSLAAAQASDDSIIALAGINSSVAEQKRNNNQHLRSFQIDYPPRKAVTASASEKEAELPKDKPKSTTPGKTTPLARVSLFRTKETKARADTYQRILRLSPWKGADKPRVGAIATGLAASGEIVFFDVTPTPTESDVIGRIRLNSDEEAEDVDIIDLEGAKYRVAYTTGSDVFVCDISSQTRSNASPEVKCVYRIPLPDKGPRARFKFRALRFLTPTTVLLLQNAPNRNGCELVTLDIHQTASKDKPLGTIVRRKKLRKTIKIGLGLDVCGLGTNPDGQEQTIIAVSGSDQSIEILTVEYNPRRGHDKLRPYTSLREVHPFSMTKICFSHFQPPAHPVTPETPPQYIKLASISMGNTVVVHTFPLAPAPPSSRTPRYVLVMPGESEVWTNFASGFAALLSILTVCLLLQAFTEIRGLMPPYLGATEWLPPDIRTAIARPYHALPPHPLPSGPVLPAVREQPPRSLRDILHAHRAAEANTDDDTDASAKTPVSSVLIQCRPDSNDIFIETPGSESSLSGMSSADEREKQQPQSPPRSWDDLDEAERSLWKQRLTDAGYWALEEGETILKGVVFGECSAFLGNQVQAGLLS